MLESLVTGAPVAITLPGTLYDTGRGYPALLLDDGPGVPAELVALSDPATAFPVLDNYEGPEYKRAIITPTSSVRCWVYTWIASVDGLSPLLGGWL